MASPRTDFTKLNYRWQVDMDAVSWIRFWKHLWGSMLFYRDKIYVWRVLNHGYFHHKRAYIWGIHSGICPCCSSQSESINHLFFGCRKLRRRWATLVVLFAGSPLASVSRQNSLWGIIKVGILSAGIVLSRWWSLSTCSSAFGAKEMKLGTREIVGRFLFVSLSVPLSPTSRLCWMSALAQRKEESGNPSCRF